MKFWFFAILLTMGVMACTRPNSHPTDRATLEKQKLVNEILRKVATQLKRETELSPCGTMGQMMNEVQKLGLSFFYYQPVDIVEGRKLLVKAVDALMGEINRDTRIHPYLARCPFAPWNIQIEILLCQSNGKEFEPGILWAMQASDGNLYYKIETPDTKQIVIVYQETYEQALARIADPSLPFVPFKPNSEKITPEELARLRKGVSFVGNDGAIWHLGEEGCWIKDSK